MKEVVTLNQTITSHLKSLSSKKDHGVGNPGPGIICLESDVEYQTKRSYLKETMCIQKQ